jgi:phospholipid/cholesterol/gamma-HCH transport system substrate-binding protein
MAQRKQLTWSELWVGLFVLVGLTLIAVAIFYVTGAGFLGPKYRLITYLPAVDGMKAGAPVELDGIEIGNVESLVLTPHPEDKAHNIALALRIDKKYQQDIRTDSTASLVTQGLLGDRYVAVTRGLTGSVLPQNGVIPGTQAVAMTELVARASSLMDSLTTVMTQVQKGNGTVGKLINDPALYNHLDDVASRVGQTVASIQRGQGTLGKLVSSDELYTKANSAVGKVDDVLTAVHDQKGALGKLVYDPGMYDSVKNVADKSNALLSGVNDGKGTLGKLVTDDALYANLKDSSANVREATAKMNSNQGTLGKMFTDPNLYDNLTGMTGDLRLLIGDFRQNPKKFLHIKLGIF